MEKEYFAFISYKREDEDWAKWLAHELEHYHLPLSLNGRDDLPKDLRPIFRDIDELSAGNLPRQIHKALENSQNLVVICSPRSADSPWVNKEIEEFISMGKLNRIFPFIIEGIPNSNNEEEECLPRAIRNLSDSDERLGANVSEYKDRPQRLCKDCPLPKENKSDKKQGNINDKGRDAAVVKIVAGMLGLGFDSLWQRYEKEKAEEEQRIKEQRENLLKIQSHFLAEKINDIVDEGDSYTARLLALEAMPKDLEDPDRPYVVDVERSLRKAFHNSSAILRGHTGGVTYAEFSPDDKTIVSSAYDNTVRVWDVSNGLQLGVLNHPAFVDHAEYSPNGKTIVCLSEYNNSIYFWDANSFELLYVQGIDKIDSPFVTFSPDSNYIVFVSSNNNINLWDVKRKKTVRSFIGHKEKIYTIKFDLKGKYIVSTSYDETIRVWDVQSGDNIYTFKIREYSTVRWAEFSPDGKNIISAEGNRICVREISSGTIVKELRASDYSIRCVSYIADGSYVVSCSDDFVIRVWGVACWKAVFTFEGHTKDVTSARFSHKGNLIVSSSWDQSVRLWDCNQHIIIDTRFKDCVANDTTLSPNGEQILINYNDGSIAIVNRNNPHNEKILKHTGYVKLKEFSRDGKLVVTSEGSIIRIWDILTGNLINTVFLNDEIWSFSLSPCANYIALTTSKENDIKILETKTGLPISTIIPDYRWNFTRLSYSYDGNFIITINGHYISIIDPLHSTIVRNIDVCPDNPDFVILSPNQKYLAYTNEQKIVTIEFDTGNKINELYGHVRYITTICFSHDNNFLLSGSQDMTLKVWDFKHGCLIDTISGPSWGISYISFFNDDQQIYASSFDGTTRVWDFIPFQKLINETNERFMNRSLTSEERKKYFLD